MSCPNCKSDNTWDDNLHWGCNDCNWCSLGGLNKTKTPSNHNNYESNFIKVKKEWFEDDITGERRYYDNS